LDSVNYGGSNHSHAVLFDSSVIFNNTSS